MKEFVKKQWVQPALTMIPLFVSTIFYFTGTTYILIGSVILLFLLVAFCRCAKSERISGCLSFQAFLCFRQTSDFLF